MRQPQFDPIGDEAEFTFETAMAEALAIWAEGGKRAEVPVTKMTVRLACCGYLTFRHNERSLTGYESAKSLFDVYVFGDAIADELIAKLETADYQAWVNEVATRLEARNSDPDPLERRRKSRSTANYIWANLRAALYHAAEHNKALKPYRNQWSDVKSLKLPKNWPQPRMIVLSEKKHEARRLYNAADSDELRDILWFLGETACRPGEAYNMLVEDYDPDRGEWNVSHSKTGPRTQVMTSAACALLNRLTMGRDPKDHVFLTPKGQPWTTARMQHPFRRAVEKAKLPKGVVPYTLRHTRISAWLTAGMPALNVALEVGTSLKMLQEHYAKFLPKDTKAQMELASQGEPPASKVAAIG